jgi:RNA polymerase sigma-70 factor (ECF subfamily)
MRYNSLSDSDLWEKIIDDDYRAFTVFFERYWYVLYKTAGKYIKDNEVCEEVVHDLFLNIWKRRNHLHITNFELYLKAAVRYQVFSYLKKQRDSTLVYLETYPEEAVSAGGNTGHDNIIYSDLENEMAEFLKQLPKRSSEIFLLSRKEHLSNAEIAERLGITKRTVENQLTNALKHLRSCLKHLALVLFLLLLLLQGQ